MGKGDKKSRKGKIRSGTYGPRRMKRPKSRSVPPRVKKRRETTEVIDGLLRFRTMFNLRKEVIENGTANGTVAELAKEVETINKSIAELDLEIDELKKGYVRFSVEELYINYGRFNETILVYFQEGSDSYQEFGEYVAGKLIYGKGQHRRLDKIINHTVFDMADAMVPIAAQQTPHAQVSDVQTLAGVGFKLSDIKRIYSIPIERNDAYRSGSMLDTIKIEVDWSAREASLVAYGFLKKVVDEQLYLMVKSDYFRFLGLKLLHEPALLTSKEKEDIYDDDNQIKDTIRLSFYRSQYQLDPSLFTDEQYQDFVKLIKNLEEDRKVDIQEELKSAGYQKSDEIIAEYKEEYERLLKAGTQFETMMLSGFGWTHLICLEPANFVHILIGHMRSFQIGELVGKTVFDFGIKEMLQLLEHIVEKHQVEIEQALTSGDDFQLGMGTAFYSGGSYYKIHIDKNGKVLSFHPYNK